MPPPENAPAMFSGAVAGTVTGARVDDDRDPVRAAEDEQGEDAQHMVPEYGNREHDGDNGGEGALSHALNVNLE